jgi:hypothetical protein
MEPEQLPVPPPALTDPKSRELARVWVAYESQHVSLATGLWEDPAAWGIMLVDLSKHIASAYQQTTGAPFSEVLDRIKQGLDAEWQTETDRPSRHLQDWERESGDGKRDAAADNLPIVSFFDSDAQDDGIAIVRICGDRLALALSLKCGGDLEVTMDPAAAHRLNETLATALRLIEEGN